uniref:Uncharacterized protein n=1 Tax=Fagus sylvatica TaxID=28930 RepID=A0A2N9IIN0_FAGSY
MLRFEFAACDFLFSLSTVVLVFVSVILDAGDRKQEREKKEAAVSALKYLFFWSLLAPSASWRGVYELLPPNPELEDLTLFHRAILASTTSSTSRTVHSRLGTATNPKPKIAFLFLTNSDLSFAPLWNKFFNTTTNNKHLYNIYIHTDPSVTIAPPGGVFQGRFITKAKKTERGSPSLISAACPSASRRLPSLPHAGVSLTPMTLFHWCRLLSKSQPAFSSLVPSLFSSSTLSAAALGVPNWYESCLFLFISSKVHIFMCYCGSV